MTWPPPSRLAALVAGIWALSPGRARAGEGDCKGTAIEADEAFTARYSDWLDATRSDLSRRHDIDRCARVGLRLDRGSGVTVSVTLLDGRTAERSVQRTEDLSGLLQALLLVPARAEPQPPPEPPPPPEAPSKRNRPSRPAFVDLRERPVSEAAPRPLGVELSALGGARIGDGQVGYGVGALSFLEVKSWLFGVMGRVDGYRSLRGSDPETALELALLAGRRLDWGAVALDLTAGPGLATPARSISRTETVRVDAMGPSKAEPPPRGAETPDVVPRLIFGARLGFSPRSVLRSFIGVDADVGRSLGSASGPGVTESSRLPSFSVGVSLGATVGTR